MSFSEGYGKEYGELFDYDEVPMMIGGVDGPRSNTHSNGPSSRAVATERLSSSRCPSEISMDLSDLQDALPEGDSNGRFASGSMHSACSDGHTSPLHQQLVSVDEDSGWKSDEEDGDGYSNQQSSAHDVNNSDLQLDDIPEFFLQNGTSDFSSFYKLSSQQDDDVQDEQQKTSKTVDEQGETDSASMSTSSLVTSQESSLRNIYQSSNGTLNSRRKVKFEISSRLEDIQEFDKPDIEDYHKLYYTAHELQRMIDGHRAEEQSKRDIVR